MDNWNRIVGYPRRNKRDRETVSEIQVQRRRDGERKGNEKDALQKNAARKSLRFGDSLISASAV